MMPDDGNFDVEARRDLIPYQEYLTQKDRRGRPTTK